MKTKMNIGVSSLILIFIVLCLVTFGLLSLSSARNDLVLAERNGEAVREFYRADQEGERFIAMADGRLREAAKGKNVSSLSSAQVGEALGEYYDKEAEIIRTDIPMDRGQALRIELEIKPDEEIGAWLSIQSYYVYNQEDYEIDQSMPVWTGE
ncbi:hypothetical protein AALB16_13705 [Lachnospiraceae bacterium 62-35]